MLTTINDYSKFQNIEITVTYLASAKSEKFENILRVVTMISVIVYERRLTTLAQLKH